MWDRLSRQVAVEREQLHRLLETHRPLLVQCSESRPNPIELSALAALLHSFYNGVENILKRISAEIDSAPPSGEFWHRKLLDSMALPRKSRPAAISRVLNDRLSEYLEFRHIFRHAYTFELHWEKMSSLVLGCEETLRLLEAELDKFLREGPAARN